MSGSDRELSGLALESLLILLARNAVGDFFFFLIGLDHWLLLLLVGFAAAVAGEDISSPLADPLSMPKIAWLVEFSQTPSPLHNLHLGHTVNADIPSPSCLPSQPAQIPRQA